MPGEKTELVVDGRTLHLSNLGKFMYPDHGYTKGQMIDYYIRISPVLLPHLKDRPITLKRYPDGINGEYFYEKRAPSHTPEWVQKTIVERSSGKPDITAVLINDLPALIWSANLANLELHTPLARAPELDCPTMVVFDLDPGPPANVVDCARVALWLRELLEGFNLPCFAKASGSKGMQLYVPLNTPVTYEETRSFALAVGQRLRADHRDNIVVEMAKHLRTGKVFIDYSQNASRKTTVCVYSLRAAHATPFVSAPVTFEELERAVRKNDPDSLFFQPHEVLARAEKHGDLFEQLPKLKCKLPKDLSAVAEPSAGGVSRSRDRKGTGITAYNAKRDFTKTKEPPGNSAPLKKESEDPMFVIQKHEASRLHYDFRLEMEGVLRSWAIPKGIPTTHEDKRLAMHVEDHPMSYARFEGIIPKGNYGGGTVMVWDIGTYSVKDGDPVRAYHAGKISMTLSGKKLNGEWTLFRLGKRGSEDRSWMLLKKTTNHAPISARKDDESALTGRNMKKIASDHDAEWISNRPETDSRQAKRKIPGDVQKGINDLPAAIPKFVEPMQSRPVSRLPSEPGLIYEVKLDGYRALALKHGGKIQLISRNENDMSRKYPDIVQALESFPGEVWMLDGEIVVLDGNGVPSFQLLESYTPAQSEGYLCYYAFDLLNFQGKTLMQLPLENRKQMLRSLIPSNDDVVRFNVSLEADPEVLEKEVRKRGLEGIVVKRKTSVYEPGKRSGAWMKWKADNAGEFTVGGFRPSGNSFDYIVVGFLEGKNLMYASRVRAGFTPHQKAELMQLLSKRKTAKCPFANLPESSSGRWGEGFTAEDMEGCVWVKPGLEVRVEFVEWTSARHLRHAKYAGTSRAPRDRG